MKALHIYGGSPSFDKDNSRIVPSGLDKSWETRRVEGLEMMVMSVEQQKERQRKNCKSTSCSHKNNNNNNSNNNNTNHNCSSSSHHHHNNNLNFLNNNNNNNNDLHQQGKCRSLSNSKKNKQLSTTMSSPQKSCLFDSLTQVEGSTVGRRQKVVYADVTHNMTPDSFKVRELEQQVLDLIHQLAQEKHQARQDKISLAKLQQQLARNKSEKPVKEMLMKELEQERRRREILDHKLREKKNDCCCQNEMAVLKKENTRLNEVIQDLLPYKNKIDRLKQSSASSSALLESELHRLRSKLESLEQDNTLTNMELRKLESIINACQHCRTQLAGQIRLDSTPHSESASTASVAVSNEGDKTKVLLERLKSLEAEKTALVLENEAQFQHYEKCLEDVTTQILQALVAQKSLKEECARLRGEVVRLREENENLKKVLPQGSASVNKDSTKQFDQSLTASNLLTTNHSASPGSFSMINTCLSQSSSNGSESLLMIGRMSLANQGREEEEPPEEEEGKRSSSLSLNEILDSALGGASSSSNTDAEDCSKISKNISEISTHKKQSLNRRSITQNSYCKELDRRMSFDGDTKMSYNFEGNLNTNCDDLSSPVFLSKNLDKSTDMSTSDSITLHSSCSCGSRQSVHSNANPTQPYVANQDSNPKIDSSTKPHQNQTFPSTTTISKTSNPIKKSFRKKFFPVGCTSPQEEKDEGYLSNKTSEGSCDAGNIYASHIS